MNLPADSSCSGRGQQEQWSSRRETIVMNAYETTSTVGEQGQVHLTAVPFAPGTEVEITVSPKLPADQALTADEARLAAARERMRELFAALDRGRNTGSIGPLRREELYDRKVLR
jgi:hypothetical protein